MYMHLSINILKYIKLPEIPISVWNKIKRCKIFLFFVYLYQVLLQETTSIIKYF